VEPAPHAPRPSLLWPGAVARPLARWDLWLLPAAYALALAVRWTILDAEPYTAEAAHYAMARGLWRGVDNVGSLFPDVVPDDFSWFFWQRPLLCLAFWPGAMLGGFTGFRVEHVLLSSAIPALSALLLRRLGTPPAWAYGCALALCLDPVLVPWNVLVLPDSLVALLTLGGLLAAHHGRPVACAALLLASCWVKEVGIVTVLALLVLSLWREADGRRAQVWPLRLGPFASSLLPAALLAFVPLVVSLQLPYGTAPGFRTAGDLDLALERLFLLLWLAPVAAMGVLLPATRRLALVALAWPAFFLLVNLATGKAIEAWYHVVPATMVATAAAATLGALPRDSPRVALRWAPAALSVLLAGLLLVQVAVPHQEPLQRSAVTPLTGDGQWDLREALAYEAVRGDDLAAVIEAVPDGSRGTWTALDMDYSLIMHPLATSAGHVHKDFTSAGEVPEDLLRWWAHAIEQRADATFLAAAPDGSATALNQAMRDAYEPCATSVGMYTVILPERCQGYGDRLVAAHRGARDG
jgi:hypothetical protein